MEIVMTKCIFILVLGAPFCFIGEGFTTSRWHRTTTTTTTAPEQERVSTTAVLPRISTTIFVHQQETNGGTGGSSNDAAFAAVTESTNVPTQSLSNNNKHNKNDNGRPISSLKSLEEFLDYVDEAPQDSLAVIKFYTKSCQLCKRIELKYKKMARYYQAAPICFAEIEKAVHHQELFTTLQVNTYPFIQIYRNGLCVASHGTESDTMFERLVHDTIQRELSMTPSDWDGFLTAFAGPITKSTEKLNDLRQLLSCSSTS